MDYQQLELAQLLTPHGDIVTLKIVRDKQTRKPKGHAFLEMVSRLAADQVCEALDDIKLQSNPLTVNIVEEKPAPTYRKVEKSADSLRVKRPRRLLQ